MAEVPIRRAAVRAADDGVAAGANSAIGAAPMYDPYWSGGGAIAAFLVLFLLCSVWRALAKKKAQKYLLIFFTNVVVMGLPVCRNYAGLSYLIRTRPGCRQKHRPLLVLLQFSALLSSSIQGPHYSLDVLMDCF